MRTPAGAMSAQSPRYEPPVLGLPTWDGSLTATERLAYLKWMQELRDRGAQPIGGLPSWLMRLIVLATFALTLAVLWFGVPRLIWPERYVPRPSFQVPTAPARGPARPPAGRPATQKGVTITGRAVSHQRGGSPPTVTPSRIRDSGGAEPAPPAGPPARPRGAPPAAPPRPAREPFVRGAGDATVFVPPNQNPRGGGGDT